MTTTAMAPASVKFPASMRHAAQRLAKKYGLSFNALIRLALAEKLERASERWDFSHQASSEIHLEEKR
jgi:hypothetical protein